MPTTKQHPVQPFRESTSKPVNPTIAILLIGTLGLLLYATAATDWSLLLWVLVVIAVLLILSTWMRARRRQGEATSFAIPYQDRVSFCAHFVPYMRQIGFEEEQLSEHRYGFALASHAQLHLGPFTFPPTAWRQLTMTLLDHEAIITGPRMTLTTLQQMLQRRTGHADMVPFPFYI